MSEPTEKTDRVQEIFNAQLILMDHFYPIERQTLGLPLFIPENLQTHMGQLRVKECAGRVSEELVEILDADIEEHRNEEIADALSFLLELFHVIGVTRIEFAPDSEFPADDSLTALYRRANERLLRRKEIDWRDLMVALWSWMHELKAKPWKLKPSLTDVLTFRTGARTIFFLFIRICFRYGVSADQLCSAYFRKHRINLARIAAT